MKHISLEGDTTKEINAVAISTDGEEKEFYFEIENTVTNKQILDKAFEIAYCNIFYNLQEVYIDRVDD